MSGPPPANAEVTEADRNLRGKKLEPEKPESTPESSTSEKPESGGLFEKLVESLKSYPFAPPPDVVTTLAVWKRILAGGFGALSVQSAVALSQVSITYIIDLRKLSALSLSAIPAAPLILFYWILISCILFSGYNRRADFVHIFRSSILFNLFIVAIGSLGLARQIAGHI